MPDSHPAWPDAIQDNDALRSTMTQLEAQRREALLALWRTSVIFVICLPLIVIPTVILMSAESGPAFPQWFPVSEERRTDPNMVVLAVVIWTTVSLSALMVFLKRFGLAPKNKYLWDYKRHIYTALCEAHFPGIDYLPQGGFPWRKFDSTHLFPFACDEFSSEDRFEGRYGTTDIQFAEAQATRITRRLSNKFRRSYERYFKGIIFVADFHKHFHGTSRMVPRGEKVKKLQQQPAVLESPEFSAAFSTWTTDQIEVRYVLSTSMMERLVALNRRHPGLRASFADDNLLLLLPTRHDYFEPSLYRGAASPRQVESFINDVKSWLAIVEDLNLNTRIWSKH